MSFFSLLIFIKIIIGPLKSIIYYFFLVFFFFSSLRFIIIIVTIVYWSNILPRMYTPLIRETFVRTKSFQNLLIIRSKSWKSHLTIPYEESKRGYKLERFNRYGLKSSIRHHNIYYKFVWTLFVCVYGSRKTLQLYTWRGKIKSKN